MLSEIYFFSSPDLVCYNLELDCKYTFKIWLYIYSRHREKQTSKQTNKSKTWVTEAEGSHGGLMSTY